MALQGSGALSFNEIGIELQRASGSILEITTAETGGYVAINPYSTYKPNGITPSSVSEWYNYNHSQVQLVPFFQITKQAPSNINVNTNFNFTITVANSGNSATNGAIVVVTDVMPTNMQFVTYNAPGWNITVSGQTIQATSYDVIQVNGAFNDITITVKIINCASGAYYNQASVYGGGSNGTQNSNTTTTNASSFYATISLTRSIQKNDCGANCTGSYVNVTSPSFTRSSCVSQADANTLATSDANNWLNANGQGQANASGSCNCNPPIYTLTKVLDSALPIYVNSAMQWKITLSIQNASTGGSIQINDDFGVYFSYNNHSKPSGWSYYQSGSTISFYTSSALPANTSYDFYLNLNANYTGNYTNNVNVIGGGGSTVSTSSSVTISQAVQPIFNIIETNNATTSYKSSSGTTGVHFIDNNTIRHSIQLQISNSGIATNSVRITKTFNGLADYGGASTHAGWSYSGGEFTNNTNLATGNYSVGYVDYKVSETLLGALSATSQFSLLFNNGQVGSTYNSYNVVGKAKINLMLYCSFVGNNNSWLANYTFVVNINGALTYLPFTISEVYSKNWLMGIMYIPIGSGVNGGSIEYFPSDFSLKDSTFTINYKLFGSCNNVNSSSIGYVLNGTNWYNQDVSIVIDFNQGSGSFITC